MTDVVECLRALRKTQGQGKQTLTNFSWGWRNKPAGQNNWKSSGASNVHVLVPLPSNVCHQFSFEEMKSATCNFHESHLVGVGGYSKVYTRVLNGMKTEVAIKRHGRDGGDVNKFQKEIATMAKLHQHHLVSLVGYCIGENEMIQIYDYMACGTLRWRLYGYNTEPRLTCRRRLEVCISVARALHYLHKCFIIHYDLTTKGILLERLFTKVLGAVSPLRLTARCMGTRGYTDPEFFITGKLTEKSNVYSFGVVLLEVVCARSVIEDTLPIKQASLVTCALNCKRKGILDLLVDPHLDGNIATRCLNKFVKTAEICVALKSVDRPSMREVLQKLEMCLIEQSRGVGDEMSVINRSSKEERRWKLEMYLSDESGGELSGDGVDGDTEINEGMDSE